MRKVLLFGGTGNLGKEIAAGLKREAYDLTVAVRNRTKAETLFGASINTVHADVTQPHTIAGICKGFDIVISALGKSVSPFERSRPSFEQVDLNGNTLILNDALRNGVRKFVYISAFGSERYRHLEYFRVHYEFEQRLRNAGIDYSILRPPALFSAFLDLIQMAKKGRLVNMGRGERLTNPISESDLANICLQYIDQRNTAIGAGGSEILSRKKLNQIIQDVVQPGKKVRTVPMAFVSLMLPLLKRFDRNAYHKLAFFRTVLRHDTIAPRLGTSRFEDYVRQKATETEPLPW